MENDFLTLIVCSNRENVKTQLIWSRIINSKYLNKIIFSSQGLARRNILKHKKIIQLKLTSLGRSKALNEGFANVHSKIIGLADDDCIINKNWAQYAVKTLDNRTISLVYGQTKPYQPNKHKGQFCPSTFKKNPNIFSVATKLDRHWVNVGFDNNVAMKRRIIDNIGGYKKWLGPNSIIPAAEDAEFILRAQIAGYKIAYNPKMIVYHNKWMSKHDHENLIEDYTLGGITAYAFYAFQGVTECRRIMLEHVKFYFYKIKADVKKIIINPVHVGPNLKNIIHMIHDLTKGILTAFVFSKIIPIPEKENVVKRFYKTT